jgi:hypothetical protein
MKKQFFAIAALALCAPASAAHAQNAPRTASPQQQQPQQQPAPQRSQTPPAQRVDLSHYGVELEPDARLVVVMAALDAAGWDAGVEPSPLRQTVRRDYAALDPATRERLRDFYTRHKLPGKATPAEQAARYVSLAYALGPAPDFIAPARTDDLPTGLLDVLDFAPLVRAFYRGANLQERLPEYMRAYRAEAEHLRLPTSVMVRDVVSYMRLQPITTTVERTAATDPTRPADQKKKSDQQNRVTVVREKPRRFFVVPDLLGAPGAINFRVIGDDYYAVVPPGTDPTSSEMRRAYIQYLVDPLVLRYNRAVAARRVEIRQLIEEQRARSGAEATPDVFLTVARSLVVAADARMNAVARLEALRQETSARLQRAGADATARASITKEAEESRAAIEDARVAQLADAFERGAVLAFYFDEQLRGLETSGFDISNFFGDMISTFELARESRRPAEYASAVQRFREARERARAAAAAEAARLGAAGGQPSEQRAALLKGLDAVDQLVRQKSYEEAETRLRAMLQEFRGEPRVFYALAQVASVSAQDAFDENLQAERLTRALSFYRQAVMAASPDTDGALISRARLASGRILLFLERKEEALKEFDAAIALGEAAGGVAYREALAEKRKLTGQP